MDRPPPQLSIPFPEAGESIPNTGVAQALDRIRQRREQDAMAAGLPVPSNGKPLPNHVLRSALFGVSAKVFRREQKIASVEGVDVFISRGYRPTQAHLDVWEHCLSLAASQGTGKQIRFTAYAFLKAIGRTNGTSDRKWLNEALLDLAGCIVRITDGRRTYFGPLIEGGTKDELTDKYVIEINPRLAVLFMGGTWTALDRKERDSLRRHPLAQWLHAFYSTHSEPFAYKVATLKELCGSDVEELWKFRQMLRRALEHLADATGWTCYIDEEDKVVVRKISNYRAINLAG